MTVDIRFFLFVIFHHIFIFPSFFSLLHPKFQFQNLTTSTIEKQQHAKKVNLDHDSFLVYASLYIS